MARRRRESRTPLKRELLCAAIAAAIGLPAMVAVSWVIVLCSTQHWGTGRAASGWVRAVPADWPAAPTQNERARGGGWMETWQAASTPGASLGSDRFMGIGRWASGWPLPALMSEMSCDRRGHDMNWRYRWSIPLPASAGKQTGWVHLPWGPVWPGFLVDWAAYTAAVLVLWRIPAWLIRRRRHGEGCCVRCGYDLAGLAAGARCPECGAAVAGA
jgi:hypothetical protein